MKTTPPKPLTETQKVFKFLSDYKKLSPENKEILKSVMSEQKNELTKKKGP